MGKSDGGLCSGELRRFGELTSIKGVGRAIKADIDGLRFMWAAAVVGFFIVTVYNVWSLTDELLMFSTATKITEQSIDYAGDTGSEVLLCNVNPYSLAEFNRTSAELDSYRRLIEGWTKLDNETDRETIGMLRSIRTELLTGQLGFFQHLGPSEASSLSHSLEHFILSCFVHFLEGVMERKVPCSQAAVRIENVINKEYFNCFKIHGGEGSGSRPSVGMSFLLHVSDVRQLNAGVTTGNVGKGALLTIGETGSMLNVETQSTELLPGKVNEVRLRRMHRKRLPQPHGSCIPREELKKKVNENYISQFKYTEESCLSTCIEYHIVETCKCEDVGQYGTLTRVFKNMSTCGDTADGREMLIQNLQCAQRWRSEFRSRCLHQCPPPCEEEIFEKRVTFLELSRAEIDQTLAQEGMQSSVPISATNNLSRTSEDVKSQELNGSNLLVVRLRRDANSFFTVEDVKAMTISDYLAKIGGTLNLWSGITVFVIVEILDVVVRLIRGTVSDQISSDRKLPDQLCPCCRRCIDAVADTQRTNDIVFSKAQVAT